MRIGMFLNAAGLYGGSQYETMAGQALGRQHEVASHNARPWVRRGHRPQSFLRAALAERSVGIDLWVRNEIALTCMTGRRKARHVGIIHHLDDSVGPWGVWNRALHRRLLANAKRCDRIVVVSRYWQNRLAELGVENTTLIYNAFDVSRFSVTSEQIRAFKQAHGLDERPVVYIGNCRQEKGVRGVWQSLRDKPYQLVASGLGDVDLPISKFLLPYEEYILLLAASDVVITMSEFLEGWNRVAHEAMLCGTPVIGSGSGGMQELLQGGEQQLCRNMEDLPEMVKNAISRRETYRSTGAAFARAFTAERFASEWLALVAAL